jgi:hypothetical protein
VSAVTRFDEKVVILEDTCHIWVGGLTADGYGAFWFDQKTEYAHRVAWLQAYGALPPAPLELDHTCRVRSCVNVAHLEAVTRTVNVQRGLATNTETCQSGRHPWVPGARRCMECKREWTRSQP